MEAPKCRLCGSKHWSGQPHAYEASEAKPEPRREPKAKPEPKPAKRSPKPRQQQSEAASMSEAPQEAKEARRTRIEELEGEVAFLKRKLAERSLSKPAPQGESKSACPVCEARRMAKVAAQKARRQKSAGERASGLREKLKAQKGTLDFKG